MHKYSKALIYLDHNATTPIDTIATENMIRYMRDEFGNPSSAYPLGARAKKAVDRARQEVASLLGCKINEVIFTSGGSESNNMALKGLVDFKNPEKRHIITSAVEHPAILNPALYLMELGVEVTILPVDRYGRVDPDDVKKAVRPNTSLISIMLANNETGTLLPVKEISKTAKEYGIPFHTDAAQAVGKIPVDVNELGVDLLSVAGHKLYGPKGVGALFIRDDLSVNSLIHGAGQEMGKRAGTESVILAVGLGSACEVARQGLEHDITKIRALRDRMQVILFDGIKDLVLNGHPNERLPNTLSISVPGIEGKKILESLPDLAASTGAACHDRAVKLSHVLAAMSVPPMVGMGTLRLSMGKSNNVDQIEKAAKRIIARVEEMRGAGK
ncbi:cysteine desulfurase family protein [Thermodesulfobacteriota bacterium]